MTKIEKAIAEIEQSGLYGNQVHQETLELALTSLRNEAARANPQPLSLAQLREMDGMPVWVETHPDNYKCGVIGKKRIGEDIVRMVIGFAYGWEWIDDIVQCGKVYAHQPKGAKGE
jgi:hypothetical protein